MSGRKLREIAGKLRSAATELDELAEEHESQAGKDALQVMERSCQDKRRYSTPEAAGQAAQDRKDAGETAELRVYQCTFCHDFHLTKSGLGDFASRRSGR